MPDDPTREDMQALVAMLPALLLAEPRPAESRGGGQRDGDRQLADRDYTAEAELLMSAIYEHQMIVEFDWGAWQVDAQRFLDPGLIAGASLDDIRRLLTLHVRKERFCEGHFAEMIASGHIAAILRRLGDLATHHASV